MAKNIEKLDLQDEFKIRFNGELHEIDANTFVNSLIHLNTIIQEVNKELKGEEKIDVKIKALEKGSFLVHIELIRSFLESIPQLFTTNNIANVSGIVTIIGGLYKAKQFLAGKKPVNETRDGNSVTIQNQQGGSLTISNHVYHIYTTNAVVNEAISKSFQTLEKDESIDGFAITDVGENPIVTIPREDFAPLSEPNQIIDKNADTVEDAEATLSIIKLSFDPKLKSDFYYNGHKITAKISDQSFYKSIDAGRSFAKGDALVCVIKINRQFDPTVNHYINKSYDITQVTRHIPRAQQRDMFQPETGNPGAE